MGAVDICVGKAVRVPETQIDVRLGGEVKNSVNLETLQARQNLTRLCDISVAKGEIWLVVNGHGVQHRRAVVELVEGDNSVLWVRQDEMPYQPTCTNIQLMSTNRISSKVSAGLGDVHEASAPSDHDVLHVRQWLELCCAHKHRGLLPETILFEGALFSPMSSAFRRATACPVSIGTSPTAEVMTVGLA